MVCSAVMTALLASPGATVNTASRIFPFGITVGALTVLFILLLLGLIATRRLLPFIVILLSFVLFALYLTGLIETAIQLFGPDGNVNGNCQTYVIGQPVSGRSLNTLAWLEQQSICESAVSTFLNTLQLIRL